MMASVELGGHRACQAVCIGGAFLSNQYVLDPYKLRGVISHLDAPASGLPTRAVGAARRCPHIGGHDHPEAPMTAPVPSSLLKDLSAEIARIVAGAAGWVAAVHSHRSRSSGFIWRPGLVVTADEALAEEGEIAVTLPDGETSARQARRTRPLDGHRPASHRPYGSGPGSAWSGGHSRPARSRSRSAPRRMGRRPRSGSSPARADPGGACAAARSTPASSSTWPCGAAPKAGWHSMPPAGRSA